VNRRMGSREKYFEQRWSSFVVGDLASGLRQRLVGIEGATRDMELLVGMLR
jgi:hypothetical protein